MRAIILIILLTFTSSFILAQEEINTARLDSLLEFLEENNRMMGAVAISKNGELVYSKAIGYRNIEKELKADPNTIYRIGSISKMFTATLIFQLIEEEKLSLDTKLDEFFPKVPNADSITISQLLSHQSGLFNITNDPQYLFYNTQAQTRDQMLERIYFYEPDFTPGEEVAYSNTNYLLLTYIIEDLTDKSYKEVVKNRIINGIGLERTYYGAEIKDASNEAHSYSYTEDWEKHSETDMTVPGGAGAMASTPADLTKFIEALFDGTLINESSLEKMLTFKGPFGYGIFRFPFHEKLGYGHTGGIDGFQSNVAYFPEEQLALAFTSNGLRENMNEIMIGLLSIIFNKPYEFPKFETISVEAEELKKYEGKFSSEQLPIDLDFKVENGLLTVQATGQPRVQLEATASHEFNFRGAGAVFKFKEDANFSELTLKQAGQEFTFIRE
ncbi:MAG: serine hydrolase domain-containing protein [Candidatus Cyclobacteriaceae bacterium M2_1C_046]